MDVVGIVKGTQRIIKTFITKYQEEHFQELVVCFEGMAIMTYWQLVRHLPLKDDSELGCHIFWQAIHDYPKNFSKL